MLENSMVKPYADDNADVMDEPGGLNCLRRLPNTTADVVFYDELWQENSQGKAWVSAILDHALKAYSHAEQRELSSDLQTKALHNMRFEIETLKAWCAIIEVASKAGKRAWEDDYLRREMDELQ